MTTIEVVWKNLEPKTYTQPEPSSFHLSYLTGIVEQLMLELLDAEDLLEHFVQLVLAEDELGGSAGRDALLVLAGILLATVDGVELSHPGAQHRLLAQPVDLR